jgi:hypothetical protein
MASSGMLRLVALVTTDVSEEHSDSIIRLSKVGKFKMEELSYSDTSVSTTVTRRNTPEVAILHSHRRENLKTYIIF